MLIKEQTMVATKADNLFKYLQTNDHFSGSHNIITTQPIVNDIIEQIPLSNQEFLVMYNIEFVISLVYNYNVVPTTITFYSDNDNKSLLATKLGVNIITDITQYNMKKPPVLLTNPPYTKETNDDASGKNGRKNISTSIINSVVKQVNPIWIGMIIPEALYSTDSSNEHRRLRDELFTKYSAYDVKFLHQKRDWNDTIRIDTVASVFGPRVPGKKVTINGRHLNQKFDINVTLNDTRVLNYETLEAYNWITSIQNGNPLITEGSKNLDTTGQSMQISKKSPLSCNLKEGKLSTADTTKWKVAFAILRANTCAVVPPGVSVPALYRYVTFNTEDEAVMFRNYMHSEPIRFIVKLFHNSRSLGGKTLQFVPVFDLTTIVQKQRFDANGNVIVTNPLDVVDADLYDHWNISQSLRDEIHNFMTNLPNGEKVPF